MPKPYQHNDSWSRKAAEEGYRARSVYKLMELDQKFRLLNTGMTIIDCGAAPGSWLQYVSQKIGSEGKAIGIDLQEIDEIAENVETHLCDMTDLDSVSGLLEGKKLDLVLSDAAPSTSGIADVDQWRSIELCQMVIEIAKQYLKPGGTCAMKVLRGADFDEFLAGLKRDWKMVKVAHVRASRDRSREVFVVLR